MSELTRAQYEQELYLGSGRKAETWGRLLRGGVWSPADLAQHADGYRASDICSTVRLRCERRGRPVPESCRRVR